MDGDLAPIIGAVAAMAAGWGYLESLRRKLVASRERKTVEPAPPAAKRTRQASPVERFAFGMPPEVKIDLHVGMVGSKNATSKFKRYGRAARRYSAERSSRAMVD